MEDGPTDIYIDNTNLSTQVVSEYEQIAAEYGVRFVVVDHFLGVALEDAALRDAYRKSPVGADVIRKMHKEAKKLTPWQYRE